MAHASFAGELAEANACDQIRFHEMGAALGQYEILPDTEGRRIDLYRFQLS